MARKVVEPRIESIDSVIKSARQVENAEAFTRESIRTDPTGQILMGIGQLLGQGSQIANKVDDRIKAKNYDDLSMDYHEKIAEFQKDYIQTPDSENKKAKSDSFFDNYKKNITSSNLASNSKAKILNQLSKAKSSFDIHTYQTIGQENIAKQNKIAQTIQDNIATTPLTGVAKLQFADSQVEPLRASIEESYNNGYITKAQFDDQVSTINKGVYSIISNNDPLLAYNTLKAKDKNGEFIIPNVKDRPKLIETAKAKAATKIFDDWDNKIIKQYTLQNQPFSKDDINYYASEIQKDPIMPQSQKNDLLQKLKSVKGKITKTKEAKIYKQQAASLATLPPEQFNGIIEDEKTFNNLKESSGLGDKYSKSKINNATYAAREKLEKDPAQGMSERYPDIDLDSSLVAQEEAGLSPRILTNNQSHAVSSIFSNPSSEAYIDAKNMPAFINGENIPLLDFFSKLVDPSLSLSKADRLKASQEAYSKHKNKFLEEAFAKTSPFLVMGANLQNNGNREDMVTATALYQIQDHKNKGNFDAIIASKTSKVADSDVLSRLYSSNIGKVWANTYGEKYVSDMASNIGDYMKYTGQTDVSDAMKKLFPNQDVISSDKVKIIHDPNRFSQGSKEMLSKFNSLTDKNRELYKEKINQSGLGKYRPNIQRRLIDNGYYRISADDPEKYEFVIRAIDPKTAISSEYILDRASFDRDVSGKLYINENLPSKKINNKSKTNIPLDNTIDQDEDEDSELEDDDII
jgi:hypothetical protein